MQVWFGKSQEQSNFFTAQKLRVRSHAHTQSGPAHAVFGAHVQQAARSEYAGLVKIKPLQDCPGLRLRPVRGVLRGTHPFIPSIASWPASPTSFETKLTSGGVLSPLLGPIKTHGRSRISGLVISLFQKQWLSGAMWWSLRGCWQPDQG